MAVKGVATTPRRLPTVMFGHPAVASQDTHNLQHPVRRPIFRAATSR